MPSSKKARVDPDPSSVGKKAKKDATALAVFDPKKPFFVYEIFRPDLDNKTVYVGRTDDVKRRSGQHVMASSPCKLVNELRKLLQVKTFRDIIKLVPELPEGVPASRIVEMEAYFIMERRTVYHARDNEHGCNAKNGDSVHEITPDRYNEIEAELANGYEWPASVGVKNDVPIEVAKARGVEVVFDGLLEEAEETGEDDEFVQALRRDMALVTADRETTERLLLSARQVARDLADNVQDRGVGRHRPRAVHQRTQFAEGQDRRRRRGRGHQRDRQCCPSRSQTAAQCRNVVERRCRRLLMELPRCWPHGKKTDSCGPTRPSRSACTRSVRGRVAIGMKKPMQ